MPSNLTPVRFRVQNFRNIDDSGWIPLERVTSFVGRNESGKTTLLKALHKFNPASAEPYVPQREFPRDRFTRDFRKGKDWPVCSVTFALSAAFRSTILAALGITAPTTATFTRFFDGSLSVEYDMAVEDASVTGADAAKLLDSFAKGARRLPEGTAEQEDSIKLLRKSLSDWATAKKEEFTKIASLKNVEGAALLKATTAAANGLAEPKTADLVETLQDGLEQLLARAQAAPIPERLDDLVTKALPVFIYFENYGILDSAIYLPRFLEDLAASPHDPRVRTINAVFRHVQLDAKSLADLGREEAAEARRNGQTVTDVMIRNDQQRKELRAVKTNSASLDITKRFSEWYGQRRHTIRYSADGDYFRIWISDDRRPGVDIELESRSKGFQWFFSFYLVFLVESESGHRDAVLLLDEPGLNLHPTAQQELLGFFEKLSESNVLLYSTHSPFLIDGEHIHRVRPVTEDDSGHSRISVDGWPRDRDTIFPLQAAAGYAMVKGLFQDRKNVLVEGMADYLYLQCLSLACRATGRTALPTDVYVTPSGGTKLMGHLASLFLGQNVRPLVLLDGDDAGRARRDALLKELYAGTERAVLLLDSALGPSVTEVEDIFGEAVLMPHLEELLGTPFRVEATDRESGSVVDHFVAAAARLGVNLPDGWKPEIARRVAVQWAAASPVTLPASVLDRAALLFAEIGKRFDEGIGA